MKPPRIVLSALALAAAGAAFSAEPFSVDKADAPPAAKVGDYKAMPDAVGIHLGMPSEAALATLRAAYKGDVQLSAPNSYPGQPKPAQLEFGVRINSLVHTPDQVWVESTPPPETPRIWRVYRSVGDPNHQVLHSQLLASLRQKYGKEAAVLGQNSNSSAGSDASAATLWWLYDEQGQPARLPGGGINEVAQCLHNFTQNDMSAESSQSRLPRNIGDRSVFTERNYCNTSLVIVQAMIGTQDIVTSYTVDMVDFPLASRTSVAAIAMMDGAAHRQQESEKQRAGQNKPSL